jgi:lipopolysaccharide transport system permease protein
MFMNENVAPEITHGVPADGIAECRGIAEAAPSPVVLSETIIRRTSGWAALDLAELWQFRELLLGLTTRDVKLRYKQTALGIIWVILQPLIAAGVFSFVFGLVGKFPSDGLPYIVFSYAGLLGWNLFSGTLTKASGCLVGNAQLISKVFFPRMLLPISTIGSSLIDFGVAVAMLVALMGIFRIEPGWPILLFPVWATLLVMMSLGVGLWSSALTVSYRDVQYIVPVALQFLMYASPIAYAASAVPAQYRVLFYLNPLAGILDAFRWSILGVGGPPTWAVAWAAVCAITLLIGGAFTFKKMEKQFADVI